MLTLSPHNLPSPAPLAPLWPARKRSLFCRNGTKIQLALAFLICALVGGDDLECPALLVATGDGGDPHDLA